MAIIPDNKATGAFKALNNKVHSDYGKELFNEANDAAIAVPGSAVYLDPINSTPATAIASGVAEFVSGYLIYDSSSNNQAWYAVYPSGHSLHTANPGTRVRDLIPPAYGVAYEVGVSIQGNGLLAGGDPRNWYFQYQAGYFYQSSGISPYRAGDGEAVKNFWAYRYIGNTATISGLDHRYALSGAVGGGSVSGVDNNRLALSGGIMTGTISGLQISGTDVQFGTIKVRSQDTDVRYALSGQFLSNSVLNDRLALSGGILSGPLFGTTISGSVGQFGTATIRNQDTDARYALSGNVLPINGGTLTGPLQGTTGAFSTSVSGAFVYGTSGVFRNLSINGQDLDARYQASGQYALSSALNDRLALSGGTLTGSLLGTTISGTTGQFGIASIRNQDTDARYALSGNVLPINGGALTGPLTGTTGAFSTSVSGVIVYGTSGIFQNLSGAVGQFNSLTVNGTNLSLYALASQLNDRLALSGGTLTGPLLGTTGAFSTSISGLTVWGTNISGQNVYATSGQFGDLRVFGNLYVSGTTATVDEINLTIKDKNIVLGAVSPASDALADGGGLTLSGTTDKTWTWVNATSGWTSNNNIDVAANWAYKINGVTVLTATSLGDAVIIDGGTY